MSDATPTDGGDHDIPDDTFLDPSEKNEDVDGPDPTFLPPDEKPPAPK